MSQASRALVHAFETGALTPQRAFFLRAELAPVSYTHLTLPTILRV